MDMEEERIFTTNVGQTSSESRSNSRHSLLEPSVCIYMYFLRSRYSHTCNIDHPVSRGHSSTTLYRLNLTE
jgi:hypothetical protein